MNHPSSKRKKLAGLLCILGPLAAVAVFLLIRSGTVSAGSYLPYLLFLLCPLSHLLMMPLMHKAMSKEKAPENRTESTDSKEQKLICH